MNAFFGRLIAYVFLSSILQLANCVGPGTG